jgi:hypothetical protein
MHYPQVKASYTVVFQFLMHRHMPLITLLILCGVMTIVIWGFFGYHMWLVARGLTTNESFKWSGVTQYFARLRKEHASASKAVEEAKAALEACSEDAKEEMQQKLELVQGENADH